VRATPCVSIPFYFHLSLQRDGSGSIVCANCLTLLDKPQDDPNIRGDAFKTLMVARLSYDATEQDLESEFGRFGPIERVCLAESLGFVSANSHADPDSC
jgi:U1 small nuclear ribonucleoprotein